MYIFAPDLPLMHRIRGRLSGLSAIALCALAPLSACTGMKHAPAVSPPPLASTPDIRPQPQPRPAVPNSKKPPQLRDSHTADTPSPEKAASIDPQSLLGLGPEDVQKRLGAPKRMENSALSRKWIYAAPGCSFSVFFYPNVKSTSFRALKYSGERNDGERIDSSDACVRKILTERNDDN
jgi:hypothetical protein